MRKKIVIFFPYFFYPPPFGSLKRGLEVILGFKSMGYEVVLCTSFFKKSRALYPVDMISLERNVVKDLLIYEPRFLGFKYNPEKRGRFHTLIDRLAGRRHWFERVIDSIAPDMILMNYPYTDVFLNHRKFDSIVRVIESHDLHSINQQMKKALVDRLGYGLLRASQINGEILEEDFFEKLDLKPDPNEFQIYDRYNFTVAISPKEAVSIAGHTQRTKVIHIPVTHEPCFINNRYDGAVLFPTGPNLFNIQGYFYFVRKILPLVKKKASSFSLQVTGACCDRLAFQDNVKLLGFVPDLKSNYESARFVICPLLGGTGQQVKIVEAMAYGLPVVALRQSAEASPIHHGENGFIANDAQEFAHYVTELWKDRELCRRLGDAARKTIAVKFSRARLLEGLLQIDGVRAN